MYVSRIGPSSIQMNTLLLRIIDYTAMIDSIVACAIGAS
jgi:hypothetical protein